MVVRCGWPQPQSGLAAGHRRRRREAALTAARTARGFSIGTGRCAHWATWR